ncbi:MAG: PAS domain-containing sensor histidine kinase, partial [Limisphaerales bacterium]
ACDYFFIFPRHTIAFDTSFDVVLVLVYVLVCAIICSLGGLMRMANRRSAGEAMEAVKQKERVEREAAERRHSQAVLQGILDTVPVGIWVLDREGKVVSSNAAGARIWGLPRPTGSLDVGSYKGWWPDTDKQIQPYEWPPARAIFNGESTFDQEVEIESFDGVRKCILISSVPLRDETGTVTGAVAVNIDISLRKHSESELAREKQRIALLHEVAAQLLSPMGRDEEIAQLYRRAGDFFQADVFLEYATTDPTTANRQLIISGGIPGDTELRFKNLQFAEAFCHTIPERREPVFANNVQQSNDPSLEVIKALGVRTYSVHPLLVGDRLLGTLAFASRHRDEFDANDREFFETLAHYVAIARDRNRLRRSLETYAHDLERAVQERTARLEESSERLRVIVETVVDGIISIDEFGIIDTVNPAAEKMFGYAAQELRGHNVSMLMPEPDRSRHDFYLEQYRRTGRRNIIGISREVSGQRKDGTVFPVYLGVSESRVAGRRFFTGILRDMSEEKQAQRRVRQARDELEQLSYSIVHDLRAPLRAMRSFSQILKDEHGRALNQEANDFLRRIIESAERMDQLVTDAFNYTTALRQELPLSVVHPDRLLMSIIESYPQFHPERAQINVAPDLPAVMANRAGLTQCFSNLLTNAVKFTPADRKPIIRVWAEKHDDIVRLWVSDEGVGIAPQHHQRIFQMFQKLQTDSPGTGIGLALVRKVVEKMHGKVGVESEPGRGARFWIELHAA